MRVLTFLHSFEPGGVERIAIRLVRHWRKLGVDAPLFLGRLDGEMAHDVGQDLEVFSAPQPIIGTASWETLWMIVSLPAVIRRERPDVLFCAGNTYVVVAIAMKLIFGKRCPPILAKISNDLARRDKPLWYRLFYRLWLRMEGRGLDHFIAMESSAHAEIVEYLGVADDRVTTIPDPALSLGMIAAARRPFLRPRVSSNGRRFVAVGRLEPQKNIPLMLRAFRSAARSDDHLTLIGDGSERRRLEALVRRLSIDRQVSFRGYVASPVEAFTGFDILLLSSNFEGVPAVILEALAANLSIIATDCSRAMGALLQEGQLGELVPVGNEIMLAAAISRATAKKPCARLSRAQAERFTVERAAEQYVAAMANLAITEAVSSLPSPSCRPRDSQDPAIGRIETV